MSEVQAPENAGLSPLGSWRGAQFLGQPSASPQTSHDDNDFIKTATLSINIYDKLINRMIAPNIRCYIY